MESAASSFCNSISKSSLQGKMIESKNPMSIHSRIMVGSGPSLSESRWRSWKNHADLSMMKRLAWSIYRFQRIVAIVAVSTIRMVVPFQIIASSGGLIRSWVVRRIEKLGSWVAGSMWTQRVGDTRCTTRLLHFHCWITFVHHRWHYTHSCVLFGLTLVLYVMYQIPFFEVHRNTWKVIAHIIFVHAHFAASKICLTFNLVDLNYSIRLLSYLFSFCLSTNIFATRLDGSWQALQKI